MALTIHTALPNSGDLILGRTLADLLDDAVARYPNPRAINQPRPDGGWTTLSTEELGSHLPEPHPSWMTRITEAWKKRYGVQ